MLSCLLLLMLVRLMCMVFGVVVRGVLVISLFCVFCCSMMIEEDVFSVNIRLVWLFLLMLLMVLFSIVLLFGGVRQCVDVKLLLVCCSVMLICCFDRVLLLSVMMLGWLFLLRLFMVRLLKLFDFSVMICDVLKWLFGCCSQILILLLMKGWFIRLRCLLLLMLVRCMIQLVGVLMI